MKYCKKCKRYKEEDQFLGKIPGNIYRTCSTCRDTSLVRHKHSSPEWRKKVSEAKRNATLSGKFNCLSPDDLPEMTRCAQCEKHGREAWQYADGKFNLRKYKTKAGVFTYSWRSICRQCEKDKYNEKYSDPENVQARRDIKTEWRKANREAVNRKNRELYHQRKNGGKKEDRRQEPLLPLRPFQYWIEQRCDYYLNHHEVLSTHDHGSVGISHLAKHCGVSVKSLRRFMLGRDGGRPLDGVRLGMVDQCLTNEGSTFIWELYPDIESYTRNTQILQLTS